MTRSKTFPTLYKQSSKGADQIWEICVLDNKIITTWGQIDGKSQRGEDVVKEGKNLGKANATTPHEQAVAEAQSRWEKQQKNKGYVLSLDAARNGEASDLVEGGILPMLAHRYDKSAEKIRYHALAQPKLDGHRCIAIVDAKGKCTLWSRTRKQIHSVPHIVAAIEKMKLPWTILDGELYNHAYHAKFEELTSLIRQETPTEGYENVQYHIYDMVTGDEFQFRHKLIVAMKLALPLVQVETIEVEDEDDLMLAFEKFLKQGYEGAIIRNKHGLYVNKRSYDLQKVKEFLDMEAVVIGVSEGRGKLAGHAIFDCKTDKGVTFSAKMKGSLDALKVYWENPKKAINRQITVQYQGLTKTGAPRFPVAVRFRKDI